MLGINVMTEKLRNVLNIRRWNERNPGKAKARAAAWRAANLEKTTVRQAAYRAANLEKEKSRMAAWYAANSERVKAQVVAWQAANPDKVKAQKTAWKAANPDKVCDCRRRHRIRRWGRTENFTEFEFQELKHQLGDICLRCKRHESELGRLSLKLVPDHVVPLAMGGSNDIENIQPLCSNGKGSCNQKKCANYANYMVHIGGKFEDRA